MKNIFENFTNKYQVTKTLRFELEPISIKKKEISLFRDQADKLQKQINDCKRKVNKELKKAIEDKLIKLEDNFKKVIDETLKNNEDMVKEKSDFAQNGVESKYIRKILSIFLNDIINDASLNKMIKDNTKLGIMFLDDYRTNLKNLINLKPKTLSIPNRIMENFKIIENNNNIFESISLPKRFRPECDKTKVISQEKIAKYNRKISDILSKIEKTTKNKNGKSKIIKLKNQILFGNDENTNLILDENEAKKRIDHCFKGFDKKISDALKFVNNLSKYDHDKICIKGKNLISLIKRLEIGETDINFNYNTIIKFQEVIQKRKTIVSDLIKSYNKLKPDYSKLLSLKGIKKNTSTVEKIFDDIKKFIAPLKCFNTDTEHEKDINDIDIAFYTKLNNIIDNFSDFNKLYDDIRNYLTTKFDYGIPLRLYFYNNGVFLGGWTRSNGSMQYGGYIFRKKNEINEYDYFIGVSSNTRLFNDENPEAELSEYEMLDYYQLKPYSSADFKDKTDKYNKTKDKTINAELIDILKNWIKSSGLPKQIKNELCQKDYATYKELETASKNYQGMVFTYYKKISKKDFDKACSINDNKKLFLFRITNKDLNYSKTYFEGLRKSRGKENLHTMYLKNALDENCTDFALSGGAKIFYRNEAQNLKKGPTHKKGDAFSISDNRKFKWDIIKDKHYTAPKILINLTVSINNAAATQDDIKRDVLKVLKASKDVNIIGVDRGERNFIYICIINQKGKLIKCESLNSFHHTDYNKLLDSKKAEDKKRQRSWMQRKGLKNLKVGYISHAINYITRLMIEHNAIIVLEDLEGLKLSRRGILKEVYSNFENQLEEKLRYLVIDKKNDDDFGHTKKGYQLIISKEMQDKIKRDDCYEKIKGFLFYVPSEYTSAIDPTTGFLKLTPRKNLGAASKYISLFKSTQPDTIPEAIEFFNNFISIDYIKNKTEEHFSFEIKFGKKGKTVKICTGKRIKYDKYDKKNPYKLVSVTEEIKQLLLKYSIIDVKEISSNLLNLKLKDRILNVNNILFHKELYNLYKLTLQLRNSDYNVDYLISPIKNSKGMFFDTRQPQSALPQDPDANGAFNIARKGLIVLNKIKNDDPNLKVSLAEYLDFCDKI